MNSTATEIDVLRATKAYLQEHGWNQMQDWSADYTDAACLSNACHYVGNRFLYTDLFGMPFDLLTSWNDSKGRTAEEVYALIDARIAFFEQQGAA